MVVPCIFSGVVMPAKFHSQMLYFCWVFPSFTTVKNGCKKTKKHFSEMKRDIGMAYHEKGKKQGLAYPIPTSLFSQMHHLTHSGMHEVS